MNLSNHEQRDLARSLFHDGLVPMSQGKPATGLIKEISDTCRSAAERYGLAPSSTAPNELNLPVSPFCRAALSTTTYSAAGAFVGDDMGSIEAALRPWSVAVAAGVRVITGLTSNYKLPLEKTASSGAWVPDLVTADASESPGTDGAANFSPNRFIVTTSISKELIMQTGGVVEQFKLASLIRDCAQGLDVGVLAGTGVSGQPGPGLFKRGDTGSITWGGAATWSKIAGVGGFINTVLNNNPGSANLAFVAHPNIVAKHRTIQKFSSDAGAGALCDTSRDFYGPYPVYQTTNVSSTLGFGFGDWSRCVVSLFGPGEGGLRILVDPYSKSISNRLNLVVEMFADVNFLRPEVFAISADTAVA